MRWTWLRIVKWPGKTRQPNRPCWVVLEALECRLTPAVGGNYWLPALTPGTIYPAADPNISNLNLDGVVQIVSQQTANFGTGTLLTDGLHIYCVRHF